MTATHLCRAFANGTGKPPTPSTPPAPTPHRRWPVTATDTTVHMDLLLRIAREKQARTVHRRPEEAAPARPSAPTPK
ncbi:hypothetical protein [Kitasatospora sp. NPDC001132]